MNLALLLSNKCQSSEQHKVLKETQDIKSSYVWL